MNFLIYLLLSITVEISTEEVQDIKSADQQLSNAATNETDDTVENRLLFLPLLKNVVNANEKITNVHKPQTFVENYITDHSNNRGDEIVICEDGGYDGPYSNIPSPVGGIMTSKNTILSNAQNYDRGSPRPNKYNPNVVDIFPEDDCDFRNDQIIVKRVIKETVPILSKLKVVHLDTVCRTYIIKRKKALMSNNNYIDILINDNSNCRCTMTARKMILNAVPIISQLTVVQLDFICATYIKKKRRLLMNDYNFIEVLLSESELEPLASKKRRKKRQLLDLNVTSFMDDENGNKKKLPNLINVMPHDKVETKTANENSTKVNVEDNSEKNVISKLNDVLSDFLPVKSSSNNR